MPPKRRTALTKEELIRVWQKVDKNNSGSVTVEEVIACSKTLGASCPEFIEHFEEVAKGGKVTRQAFLDFCLGTKRDTSHERTVDREVVLSDLKRVFDEIVGPSGGELRLADFVEHKVKLKAVCPELLENFSTADLDGSCTLSWEEVKIFAAGTDEWLEFQFDRIIGLGTLKDQVRQFHRSVVLDNKRRQAGHEIKTGGKYHMIFQGNPGTGKTTVARLVAQLLHRIGIIESDLLVEVQRDKLVAEYVGQTGPKTQKMIEEATKGILFVDEAYRLSQGGGKNDFGREAIEQLMGAMNEPPGKAPVMVFAGYPDDMDAFMKANSGLYRRIAYTFDFTDYSPVDLAQILDGIASSAGFQLASGLKERNFAKLAKVIEDNTLPQARELMNGGICERIFAYAKQSLDAREASKGTGANPSIELQEDDILEACKRIPPPPPRDAAPPAGDGGGGGGGADGADTAMLRARAEKAEARCTSLQGELAAAKAELQVLKKGGAGAGDPAAAARAEGRAAAAEAEARRAADRSAQLEADLARARAELDSLQRASADGPSGADAVEVARLEGRAAAAEAEAARLGKELADAREETRDAKALIASSGADAVEMARLEGRAAAAEAEAARLGKELADAREEIDNLKKELAAAREAERAALQRELEAARTGGGGGAVQPPKSYEVLPCVVYSSGCVWFFTVVVLTFIWRNLVRLFNFLRAKAMGEDKKSTVVPVTDGSAGAADPGKPSGGAGGGGGGASPPASGGAGGGGGGALPPTVP